MVNSVETSGVGYEGLTDHAVNERSGPPCSMLADSSDSEITTTMDGIWDDLNLRFMIPDITHHVNSIPRMGRPSTCRSVIKHPTMECDVWM